MKTSLGIVVFAAMAAASLAAEPKRLLVVTASTGFRHSSIELTEKMIRDLAAKSGDFVVTSTMDHPDYPDFSGGGAGGLFGAQLADGTPGQQTFIRKLNDRVNSPLIPLQAAVDAARQALTEASLSSARNAAQIETRVRALADAELKLALERATRFAALQASDNRITPQQVLALTGRGAQGAVPGMAFAPQVGAATPLQQKAIAAANSNPDIVARAAAVDAARTALRGSFMEPREQIASKVAALASAEQELAAARAAELARIQTTAGRFQPAVLRTLVGRFALPLTGATVNDGGVKVFADMLNPQALRNYDGVFFISSVGTLPFPDLDGMLAWVRDGGAWMGNHGSSDAMHGVTRFFDMMGGEFTGHGSQTREVMTVIDPTHPIGAAIGSPTITVYDEMYTFENANYDQSKVRSILSFTKSMNDGMHSPVGVDGHWPSTWVKTYGRGKVFYTALGHREDVVDPNYGTPQTRMNPPEVAQAFQRMTHAGIRWALGLIPGDATPQVKVPTPAGGPGVRGGRGGGG